MIGQYIVALTCVGVREEWFCGNACQAPVGQKVLEYCAEGHKEIDKSSEVVVFGEEVRSRQRTEVSVEEEKNGDTIFKSMKL